MPLEFATALLLLASFLFSGLEAALVEMTEARLRTEASKEGTRATELRQLFEKKADLLAVILVLENAANVCAFGLTALLLAQNAGVWGLFLAFVLGLPVYLLWGKLAPKTLFRNYPWWLLRHCAWMLRLLRAIALPMTLLGRFLFRGNQPAEPTLGSLNQGRDALRALTRSIQREGTLTAGETAMIEQILDFEKITVGDLMRPLSRVTAVPATMPAQNVLQLARDTPFDQFPVMAANGDLVGLVRVFEILRHSEAGATAGDYVRRLLRVPAGTKALVALRNLRRTRVELALIQGKGGRPLGIITSHDIVEALLQPLPITA